MKKQWIEFNKSYGLGDDCFYNQPFNKPGTIIETDDGYRLLIGHINEMGGIRNTYVLITKDIIITKYLVLDLKEFELDE